MNKFIKLSLLSFLVVSSMAKADPTQSNRLLYETANRTSSTEKSLDVKSLNQTELSQKAQEWGLTTEEWQRYLELQKGERGIWSPNLDPLTTLGIEAKTEEERTRYAELLARKMYERVERELAFNVLMTKPLPNFILMNCLLRLNRIFLNLPDG